MSAAADLGPVAPNRVISLGVYLRHPDPAGEEALLRDMYTPGTPAFRRFLTPQEWDARFGVAPADQAEVAARLSRAGLSISAVSPAHDRLEVSGTADQVERAFSVSLHDYLTPGGQVFFANAEAPLVPARVLAVTGLSDLGKLVNHTHQGGCASGVCVGMITVGELRAVYHSDPGHTGSGEKIGILGIGRTDTVVPNLRKFEAENGLPQVGVVTKNTPDDVGSKDDSGQGEWDMDSEASGGMAPGASEIDFYFSKYLNDPAQFALYAEDPQGPRQANASFGGCESLNLAFGNVAGGSPQLRKLAGEGRTLFVSTGDTGGSCTVLTGNGFLNTGVPQVEWPSSSRWVVAVGGTVLYTDGSGGRASLPGGDQAEYAWSHTGGGTSIVETEPDWQKPIPLVAGRCLFNEAPGPGAAEPCRGTPDVSAMSGDITVLADAVGGPYYGNGMADVESGLDTADGGTSLSAPLWTGMWASIQSAHAGGFGFAAPALYSLGLNSADSRDFYDVTRGGNGQFVALARSAQDPTGWDYVSGLGAPSVTNLIADLLSPPPAASSVASVPSVAGALSRPAVPISSRQHHRGPTLL